MTDQPSPFRAVSETIIASLRRLPDLRAALEALILFLVLVLAGVAAVRLGVLELRPAVREAGALTVSLSAFLFPALTEELAFRGWLRPGQHVAAGLSLAAFVAWHPLQALAGSPFAHPDFLDPAFLVLVALLGAACTASRLRSGSIWPAAIIHWGIIVLWQALFAGPAIVEPA
jgi:predicted Abi (CAAX) family protease